MAKRKGINSPPQPQSTVEEREAQEQKEIDQRIEVLRAEGVRGALDIDLSDPTPEASPPERERGFPNFLEPLKRFYGSKGIPTPVLDQFIEFAEKLDKSVESGMVPRAADESMKEFLIKLGIPAKDLRNTVRNVPKTKIENKSREKQEADGINTEPPATRVEPFIGPEKEQPVVSPHAYSVDIPLDIGDTPAQSRGMLRNLVERLTEVTGAASERFTKSKNYLNERAKKIDAEAGKMGSVEKMFRKMGEQYNKLSFREKLGVGVVLGASAVVSGGASIYLPYAFTSLLGVQRAYGMASMFLNQEKELRKKKVGESGQIMGMKERAFLDAALYTLGAGYAIKEGIEVANEYGIVERMREGLSSILGYSPDTSGTDALKVERPAVAPEAPQPAAAAAAGEVPTATPPVPELPSINVEVKAGQGYEWMMKRVWEGLQELKSQGLDPNTYAEGSDARRLLNADTSSIDKVVHDIAENPERGFYTPDGRSFQVNLGDKMSIDADGNIRLNDVVKAPEGAPTTPAYHPETSGAQPEVRMPPVEPSTSAAPAPIVEPPTLQEQVIVSPEPIKTVDLTQEQETVTLGPETAPPPASETNLDFKVNANGLPVDVTRAGSYLDTQGNKIIFGGSLEERVAEAAKLVREDHSLVIYFDSTPPASIFNWSPNHEISKASWFEGSGGTVDPTGSVPVEVRQVRIVNDTIDPSLRGWKLPSIDDLKEVYKPITKTP